MKSHLILRETHLRILLPALFFVSCSAACRAADPAVPGSGGTITAAPAAKAGWVEPFKVEPGKEYVYKQSGGTDQKLEVYFPPGWTPKSDVPAILFFHGGGWVAGDLKQFRYECKYFASRGLVAATASYQMLPGPQKAALQPKGAYIRPCVIDAKSAIRWVKAHAAELGIDPNRIIVGGGSAGGHLAVLATVNSDLNDPGDPAGIDTKVVAYVLFNPGFPEEDDAEVDPFKQVKSPLPPAIVFHGTLDPYLPRSVALIAQLKNLGDRDVELWTAQDKRHGFFNYEPWTDVVLAQSDRFLAAHGLLKGDPTLPQPPHGETLVKAAQ